MTVRVSINGESRRVPPGTTVADVVAGLAPRTGAAEPAGRGIAVAINDEVVPRAAWTETVLADADRIEVLTAVQGG